MAGTFGGLIFVESSNDQPAQADGLFGCGGGESDRRNGEREGMPRATVRRWLDASTGVACISVHTGVSAPEEVPGCQSRGASVRNSSERDVVTK